MKEFTFSNSDNTFRLEFHTDHIDGMDNFTVHDIKFDPKDSDLTIEDIIRAGLNYRRLPYTKAAFKAFAENNNYKLTQFDYQNGTKTVLNNPTALAISTDTIKDGTPGVVDVQTLAIPVTSSVTQGDYVSIINWNGEKLVAWLDKDGDGTEPTGALYVASDYQVKVPVVTGGTAAENAAAFVAAINSTGNQFASWTKYVTVADAGSGNVTVTQTRAGDIDAAAPKNADDSGAGSITVTATQNGVDGTVYGEEIEVVGGNTPYTYELKEDGNTDLPAGLSFNATTGKLEGVATEEKEDAVLNVTVTDVFGVTDTAELSFVIRTQS